MELTTRSAAIGANVSHRSAQRAIVDGSLSPLRLVGRQVLLDDVAVQAWRRSRGRGRRWTPHVRDAALDLLSGTPTQHVTGTVLSRLKASVRGMDAVQIAHAVGGLGAWARYRRLGVIAGHDPIGPSQLDAASLGLSAGEAWMRFIRVDDLASFENTEAVALDADGDLGVVERPADDRIARVLIDAYLLGDVRTAHAAGLKLEEAARAV